MSYYRSGDEDALAGCLVIIFLLAFMALATLGVPWFVVSNMGPPVPREPEVIFIPQLEAAQVVGDTDGMEVVYLLE